MSLRVAVNFPYFVPYAGYFRLFTSTDLFVVFDCVPFPRRGFVHRNRLPRADGGAGWLTLALDKTPRDTLIRDMRLAGDAAARMQQAWRRFPALRDPAAREHPLASLCAAPAGDFVDYLVRTLRLTSELLELPFEVVRSSTLRFDTSQRGEARVLSILESLGASAYVNAPGGRHLYDRRRFAARGMSLDYLDPYRGPAWSILYRLLSEPAAQVRADIVRQSLLRDGRGATWPT